MLADAQDADACIELTVIKDEMERLLLRLKPRLLLTADGRKWLEPFNELESADQLEV